MARTDYTVYTALAYAGRSGDPRFLLRGTWTRQTRAVVLLAAGHSKLDAFCLGAVSRDDRCHGYHAQAVGRQRAPHLPSSAGASGHE